MTVRQSNLLRRTLTGLIFAAGLTGASPATGQVALSPAFKQAGKPAVAPEKTELRKVTLYPQAAPDPLLDYPLWPMPMNRKQSNPMPRIDRAVILAAQLPEQAKSEFNQNYDAFFDSPLDQFPVEKAREALRQCRNVLKEVAYAENSMQPEYELQLDQLSVSELVSTLLPELQELRTLNRLLMLRARLAIVEKRWDDMVDDCRRSFRLSEIASHSTHFLVGRLVGFAIAANTMETLQLAIQQPDCPNLYWSLAALPESRLFEVQESIEFETILLSRIFEKAQDLPDDPIGEQAASMRLRQIVDEASRLLADMDFSPNGLALSQMTSGVMMVVFAPQARKMLAETERWKGRVELLSDSEAVLRASDLSYRRLRDRCLAWSTLPRAEWEHYQQELANAFDVQQQPFGPSMFHALISTLQPAMNSVLNSGARTEQFRNYLMTLEALRMHAAQTGQLPETLEQLRPVPAWIDSLSTKPFEYERKSPTVAVLTKSPRIPGDKDTQTQIELKEKP